MSVDNPDSLILQAMTAHRDGRWHDAEMGYRAVLRVAPHDHRALGQLGLIQIQFGRLVVGFSLLRQAIVLVPDEPAHYANAADRYYATGSIRHAAKHASCAVRLAPQPLGPAHWMLWRANHALGRAAGIGLAKSLVASEPGNAGAWFAYAESCLGQRQARPAASATKRAVALAPVLVDARLTQARALQESGHSRPAEVASRIAIVLAPQALQGYLALGNALAARTESRAAQRTLLRLHILDPIGPLPVGNILAAVLMDPAPRIDVVQWIQRETGRRFGAPRALTLSRSMSARPPRIGLVSPGYCAHPMAYMTAGLFLGHDTAQAEIFAYADLAEERADEWTKLIADAADGFRFVGGWSDAELIAQIKADRIDILIDVNGHRAGSRLALLAMKPAPIILSWPLDMLLGLGLSAVDATVLDRSHVVPQCDHLFKSPLLMMDRVFVGYHPPLRAPEVSDLPFRRNGFITFGSLVSPAKIGSASLDLWATAMRKVPDSRLILRYYGLDDPDVAERIQNGLISRAVDVTRLDLRGGGRQMDMLSTYGEIDIGLDSQPYSGGTTTLEALWMGVPVVTMPGLLPTSRHALAYVSAVGLSDLVAHNIEAFGECAASLARSPERMADLRASLRSRLLQSPLVDHRGFAKAFLELVVQFWHKR